MKKVLIIITALIISLVILLELLPYDNQINTTPEPYYDGFGDSTLVDILIKQS